MSLSNYCYDPYYELSKNVEYAGSQGIMRPKYLIPMDLHGDKAKNEMTATFELPGLTRDNISIDVVNNKLVVSGSAENIEDVDEGGYGLRERAYGRFSRTIPLPNGTKPESINARLDNGILTVKFPQQQHPSEEKKITIS